MQPPNYPADVPGQASQQPSQPVGAGGEPAASGGPQQRPPGAGRQQARAPADQQVQSPTLQWVSISSPNQGVALGEEDRVLEAYYDPQRRSWEALVVVLPRETGGESEED
ncbi:MAG: hypothetical protein ABEJ31_05615 [Haloarculaceae archaeon]